MQSYGSEIEEEIEWSQRLARKCQELGYPTDTPGFAALSAGIGDIYGGLPGDLQRLPSEISSGGPR